MTDERQPDPLSTVGIPVARCRCGAERSLDRPERCKNGHPWVGLAGPALVVGATSETFWREHEAERRGIAAAVIADAGFTPEDAPTALQLAARSIAQAAVLQESAFERLVAERGPFTSTGRTRRSFGIWLKASGRLERGLRLVGLQRVPRPVEDGVNYFKKL
jgi:hypothetical protein